MVVHNWCNRSMDKRIVVTCKFLCLWMCVRDWLNIDRWKTFDRSIGVFQLGDLYRSWNSDMSVINLVALL